MGFNRKNTRDHLFFTFIWEEGVKRTQNIATEQEAIWLRGCMKYFKRCKKTQETVICGQCRATKADCDETLKLSSVFSFSRFTLASRSKWAWQPPAVMNQKHFSSITSKHSHPFYMPSAFHSAPRDPRLNPFSLPPLFTAAPLQCFPSK